VSESAAFGELEFQKAAPEWLATREPFLHPRTHREYQFCIKTLMPFFKRKRLVEITAYDIRSYQNQRRVTCGAAAINHECGVLQQMLKRACLWGKIEGDYATAVCGWRCWG